MSVLQKYCILPHDGEPTIAVLSTSFEGLPQAVLAGLVHIYKLGERAANSSPPLPDGVVSYQPILLHAFLHPTFYRSYQLVEDNTYHTIISSGVGLERSIMHEAMKLMISDYTYWRSIGPWFAPSFSPSEEADHARLIHWYAYGSFCALHIIDSGRAPFPVSPFFLLLLIAGKDGFTYLTDKLVTALDSESADKLRPWFDLPWDQELPTSMRADVCQTIIAHAEFDVSLNHAVFMYQNLTLPMVLRLA